MCPQFGMVVQKPSFFLATSHTKNNAKAIETEIFQCLFAYHQFVITHKKCALKISVLRVINLIRKLDVSSRKYTNFCSNVRNVGYI